ncbi:cyclin-T isoform X2 [Pseudomyrmex gracilis]|uniref:cyclin-T isoform X2 n=1 Tax=Pseudomyrmex gracilis TaxID=219809 RepID=UPI000994AD13|nr:cyclin-T isoform X2 [Pseudomyrmex gracilis]
MASDERWYFTKEQLANTPSRRSGLDADKELSYRQQAANFIQDMGQRLVVSQLCINTAIVYMHRFYMFHSLNQFPRNSIAIAALFLAAKVEEQPRKLEHVIKMAHLCLFRDQGPPDSRSDQYLEHAQDLVFNENVLLQTLGFDVAIDHPHTHVVRCCQLVKASKELAQTSYFMASNSLHLTTMCLQYKPTVVACFCIHLACKWSNWEIPQSTEGKQWFWYVDRTVTAELLQELTDEFLHIFDKCPSRLKKKIMSISANQSPSIHHSSLPNSPFDAEPRKIQSPIDGSGASTSSGYSSRSHHSQQEKQDRQEDKKAMAIAGPSTSRTAVDYHREYREKKERERLEREKASTMSTSHIDLNKSHHSHHHKPMSNTTNVPNKHQVPSSVQKSSTSLHHNHYMKMGPVPQRHSTGSQPREATNRQRLPRDHNVSAGSIAHSSHVNANLDSSLPSESSSHRTDGNVVQDSTTSLHGRSQEKLSNNNHSGHRLNVLDSKHQTSSHDKRLYRGEDPRLKSGKYPDISKIENSARRKPDERCEEVRQRCEEVRKLIEKPPPKQADVPYLINTAPQKQQVHPSKYSNQQQPEKSQSSSLPGDSKHGTMSISQNMLSQDKSPNVSVPHTLLPHKSVKQIYNQPNTVSLSVPKDTIKNGSSQSCLPSLSNIDDSKLEKRPRTTAYEDSVEKNSADAQQNAILHTPPSKHRSLFSPETPTMKEPHPQSSKPKSKQKTPPISATKTISQFVSSPTSQDSLKRSCPSDNVTSMHKRLRASNNSESEQPKKKIEDISNMEAMKMLGRVPDMIQPIRDNILLSSNGKNSNNSMTSVINDMKPPELIKPFEEHSRFNTQYKTSLINMNMLTNGMDMNTAMRQEAPEHRVKKEYQEHYMKKDQSGQKTVEPSHSHFQPKLEYSSPMKSAQSISALLQEPLAPMPSLLQSLQQQHSQVPLQQMHQEQQSIHHSVTDHQLPMVTQCLSIPTESDNLTPIASTVDISALSCVPIIQQSSRTNEPESTTQGASEPTTSIIPTEEKRSEHHKSEKKKKKEKHKHKDKEKSKEKHKHKHKDKDKERHREKKDKDKSDEVPTAAPIKITIPKDKLNLSTETSPISGNVSVTSDKNITPQSTGLKIKIPKERLKGTDSVPSSSPAPLSVVPLKFKIRTTDGIYRSSAAAPTSLPALPPPTSSSSLLLPTSSSSSLILPSSSSSMSSSNGSMHATESTNETPSRKRERIDLIGDNSTTVAKKQMMISATGYGQGYRPGERQNGRHYNSGNNKERHSSSHHKSYNKLSQSQQSHTS